MNGTKRLAYLSVTIVAFEKHMLVVLVQSQNKIEDYFESQDVPS